MTKSKNTTQRAERILAQPTVHTFNFKKVPLEKYAETLKVLFANPDFSELVEKRNAMVQSASRLCPNSNEMLFLIKNIQQRDRKLADMLYSALVQANLHAEETYDFFSFTTLLKYYVDYSREGMVEQVDSLACNLDRITFLADMLESLLTDVKADMRAIFGDSIEFNQFDAVAQVLNQLRGFFKSTRSEDSDSQDAQLYFEYSDSINEYLAKRLKTYTDKYRRLHPLPLIYTQQDMIAAVNKFFGVDHFFGDEIIKHTESGGCYIDELSLIRKLTFQQAQKLSNYVDPTRLDDDRHNSSFAVTDAIMRQFNPVHK